MEKETLDLLEAALEAVRGDLTPRVEELAEKSSAGTLTPEHAERVVQADDLGVLALLLGEIMHADRFYRGANSTEIYDKKAGEFMKWLEKCHDLVFEATKAANWFAECVRKYLNPSFFATEGKFVIAYESGLTVSDYRPEYTEEERDKLRSEYETA
ncbi:MAG TPA: hypothetical protein VGF69_08880 [Thermoanaerobaculia bacterium]|jgi:hypothetical protein